MIGHGGSTTVAEADNAATVHLSFQEKMVPPERLRTPDPLITNQMLYQLSYKGSGVRLAQTFYL